MATSWKYQRCRKAGSPEDLLTKCWQSIIKAEEMLIKNDDPYQVQQAIYSLSSAVKTFLMVRGFVDGDYEMNHKLKVPIPVSNLDKEYVENLLATQLGVQINDLRKLEIPDEVFQVKRLQLILKRQTKKHNE